MESVPKLYDWAFIPRADAGGAHECAKYVARFAVPEDWGGDLRVLEAYLEANFELAYMQGRVVTEPERYSYWRAGRLLSLTGEPITIVCVRNKVEDRQPFFFVRVCVGQRFNVTVDGEDVTLDAPPPPEYEPPEFRPDYFLRYNFDHYLGDHSERIEPFAPGLNNYQRFLFIYGAINQAKLHWSDLVVPSWYRDRNATAGRYQWLLPLFLRVEDHSLKPDLIATLDPDDELMHYSIRTLILPEWAFPHARAINKGGGQFRHWR